MSVDIIKEKFIMEYQFYKGFYKKSFLGVLTLGILAAFFFLSFYFEDFIIQQTNSLAEQMIDGNKEDPTNVQKFLSILLNNLFVGGTVILCGFIPIYGLPIIYGLLSFASVGIIAGYGIFTNYDYCIFTPRNN